MACDVNLAHLGRQPGVDKRHCLLAARNLRQANCHTTTTASLSWDWHCNERVPEVSIDPFTWPNSVSSSASSYLKRQTEYSQHTRRETPVDPCNLRPHCLPLNPPDVRPAAPSRSSVRPPAESDRRHRQLPTSPEFFLLGRETKQLISQYGVKVTNILHLHPEIDKALCNSLQRASPRE